MDTHLGDPVNHLWTHCKSLCLFDKTFLRWWTIRGGVVTIRKDKKVWELL